MGELFTFYPRKPPSSVFFPEPSFPNFVDDVVEQLSLLHHSLLHHQSYFILFPICRLYSVWWDVCAWRRR